MPDSQSLEEVMKSNPPHLVVQFRRGPDGGEQFQWGITGSMPLLRVLGRLTRAQAHLSGVSMGAGEPALQTCDAPVFVLAYVRHKEGVGSYLACWVGKDIPTDALVGMLETIKLTLGTSGLAQRQAPPIITPHNGKPGGIIGLDGRPFKR